MEPEKCSLRKIKSTSIRDHSMKIAGIISEMLKGSDFIADSTTPILWDSMTELGYLFGGKWRVSGPIAAC
jgi:hypothetical protein